MRSQGVVLGAPRGKDGFGLRPIDQRLSQHLEIQGSVEAFDLALGLGVIGRAMTDGDAEPEQPDAEAGQGLGLVGIAPGRSIVGQDAPGQAIAAEDLRQRCFDGGLGLVGTPAQSQQIATVIVEDAQRVTASALERNRSLEVDLHQATGLLGFKALPGARRRLGGIDQSLPLQDRGAGADSGSRSLRAQPAPTAASPHPSADAPGALGDLALDGRVGLAGLACGRRLRSTNPASPSAQ